MFTQVDDDDNTPGALRRVTSCPAINIDDSKKPVSTNSLRIRAPTNGNNKIAPITSNPVLPFETVKQPVKGPTVADIEYA